MALAIQSQSTPKYSVQLAPFISVAPKDQLAQEAYPGELAQLRQQSNQLDQLVDVIPAGVVILNGNGIVVKINQKALDLLDEPLLGLRWLDVINRAFKPRADDYHEVSLHDGRRVKLDISALENQPGQLILITDLTETRLLQDKIAHMQRLSSLGKMVSSLAHQIRTPLSAAMLYGANLANPNLKAQAREGFQEKLMLRLNELEHQVNDMLLFAKSGSQQVVEALSVNQFIQEAIEALAPQAEKAGASIDIQKCPHDCQLMGNKQALTGALQNIIDNSIKVIGAGAQINISAYCQQDKLFISVQDNGPGVPAEFIDKLFEPFVTSRAQGTGLGLAVVNAVMKSHQGSVTLLSQAEQPAHFVMQLPIFHEQPLTKKTKIESQGEK
jgi:two-component system sensor histidine kinase FlrB